jgi:hypothetical protein
LVGAGERGAISEVRGAAVIIGMFPLAGVLTEGTFYQSRQRFPEPMVVILFFRPE